MKYDLYLSPCVGGSRARPGTAQCTCREPGSEGVDTCQFVSRLPITLENPQTTFDMLQYEWFVGGVLVSGKVSMGCYLRIIV